MVKGIVRLVIYMALLALSMVGNVYLHELGHFAVADAFGLGPEAHFMSYSDLKEVSFSAQSIPLAYVGYSATSNNLQDVLIALAGPGVNVGIAVLLAILYRYTPLKERFSVKLAYFVMLLPALFAVISNIVPLVGTDGFVALKALASLI